MARNVILFVSTTAALVLLFIGYMALVGTPASDQQPRPSAAIEPSAATDVPEEKKVRIETPDGPLEIDPGGPVYYVDYDKLGRPVASYSWQAWEKVPGPRNELAATEPEMSRRLPTGMIMTIGAQRGQFVADGLGGANPRPRLGWLAGNATIIFDRETADRRTPIEQRPQDRITISMDRMDFDLEVGELKTSGPLRVESADFEITGTGLELIWNQDDNRVEKLLIEEGGTMVFGGDLLAALGRPSDRGRPDQPPPVSQPAAPAARPVRQKTREPTAYRCAFSDSVSVEYYVGDERRGALSADALDLLVDVAGRSGVRSSRHEAPASAPASAPTNAPAESPQRRAVVRWAGRLLIRPDLDPPSSDQPRRRFEARGAPVTVELPTGRVVCSRLALHEETRRLWLYPTERGCVEVSIGRELAVQAASVFVDLEADLIKLVGDVLFRSGVGRSAGSDALTISASLWAELHLAGQHERDVGAGLFDDPFASRPPESAVFVGDVSARYQNQLLRANRLEAAFAPAGESAASVLPQKDRIVRASSESPKHTRMRSTGRAEARGSSLGYDASTTTQYTGESAPAEPGPADQGGPALRTMLDSAVASGDVHLTVADPDARRGWRRALERGVQNLRRVAAGSQADDPLRELRPPASGEDRSLTCASLRLDFAPAGDEVRIRDVEAVGAVELYDRGSHFAARGRRLNATLTPDEDLHLATVTGTDANPAIVQSRAYDLRGGEIEADNLARTLHIDGPSTLRFDSRRSLQGFTRAGGDESITVTSSESLHVDEHGNTVEFVGNVAAGTENEQLLADTLTLVLEDVSAETDASASAGAPAAFRTWFDSLHGRRESDRSSRSLFGDAGSADDTRKELARVVARNAVMQAESYAPDGVRLLEHQSIGAPELQIDVRRRMIRTIGETKLGMTDYRLNRETEAASPSVDVSSSLMTRGPSQTAMVCQQGLTYVLGPEGPGRQDSALLEGNVALRHVAGQRIEDLDQMLPDVARNPELLQNLESRNSWLFCNRLEVLFAAGDATLTPALLDSGRDSMRLSWFNAFGNVYLRDQQEDNSREVYAHQLEYDSANAIIRVLGLPEEGIEARIYDLNPKTGRLNMPASGAEFIINLSTGTIEAKQIHGRTGG